VRDETGYLAAYGIPVDEGLSERLVEVWSHPTRETWTALEFSGTANQPSVVAVCALRTEEAPAGPPLPGLRVLRGRQRPLLAALDPRSVDRLEPDGAAVRLPCGLLDGVVWRVHSTDSALIEQTHL
jgi:type VII secretion protein EccE